MMRAGPAGPPLIEVAGRFTGGTIEEAIDAFEKACSGEIYDSVKILERIGRADGVLVRYEVRWKHSVFDDYAYGAHQAWAVVRSGDGFVVAAATKDHHA